MRGTPGTATPEDRVVIPLATARSVLLWGAAILIVVGPFAWLFIRTELSGGQRVAGAVAALALFAGVLFRLATRFVAVDWSGVGVRGLFRSRHVEWSAIEEVYVAYAFGQREASPTLSLRLSGNSWRGDVEVIQGSDWPAGREQALRILRAVNAYAEARGVPSSADEALLTPTVR